MQEEEQWRQDTTLRRTSGHTHCVGQGTIHKRSLTSLELEVENPHGQGGEGGAGSQTITVVVWAYGTVNCYGSIVL